MDMSSMSLAELIVARDEVNAKGQRLNTMAYNTSGEPSHALLNEAEVCFMEGRMYYTQIKRIMKAQKKALKGPSLYERFVNFIRGRR